MTTTMPALAERAWVDVDLAALVTNARTVQARAGARLLPMVKANGYGLGAVPVARALEAVRPWGFGVATPREGAELRAGGILAPIVVFSPLNPSWIPLYLEHRLTPSIGDVAGLAAWQPHGGPFHLEIDTGMGRAGIRWDDAEQLRALFLPLEDRRDAWGPARVLHAATELAGVAKTGPIPPFVTALAADQRAAVQPLARELLRRDGERHVSPGQE
jgi:hypothetical protein